MDDLNEMLEAMKKKATEKRLAIVWECPLLDNYPEVEWKGTWTEYLELAGGVGVVLLYVAAQKFDFVQENTNRASSGSLEGRRRLLYTSSEEDQVLWLAQRLVEQTERWGKHNQMIGHVECLWFKDGVAHRLSLKTPWYLAYEDTVNKALEEAESVEEADRQIRTQEEAAKTFQRAEQLAQHERFPDASNSEKRLFMAQQLFSDSADDRLILTRIVHLAEMIYWWEVEPEIRTSKAQKARDLRASGESIKNIAVVLKMSEARVRAALETAEI